MLLATMAELAMTAVVNNQLVCGMVPTQMLGKKKNKKT